MWKAVFKNVTSCWTPLSSLMLARCFFCPSLIESCPICFLIFNFTLYVCMYVFEEETDAPASVVIVAGSLVQAGIGNSGDPRLKENEKSGKDFKVIHQA